MQVTERLYLTGDGKVVKEGDPAAAFLLAAEGDEIPDEDAARYGLTKTKQQEPAKNKQRSKAGDK